MTGKHDSGKTSDSPRSGYGGRHSTDPPATARTDLTRAFGPKDAPKEGGK